MSQHRLSIRIYSEDTDCFGIVYHANFLKYMSRGRVEWFRESGYTIETLQAEGYVFPVASVNIDYYSPVRLGELIELRTEIHKVGRVSLLYHQTFYRDGEQKPLCRGIVKIACVNSETLAPVALPETIKRGFEHG